MLIFLKNELSSPSYHKEGELNMSRTAKILFAALILSSNAYCARRSEEQICSKYKHRIRELELRIKKLEKENTRFKDKTNGSTRSLLKRNIK
jgi:hypothetical protein